MKKLWCGLFFDILIEYGFPRCLSGLSAFKASKISSNLLQKWAVAKADDGSLSETAKHFTYNNAPGLTVQLYSIIFIRAIKIFFQLVYC